MKRVVLFHLLCFISLLLKSQTRFQVLAGGEITNTSFGASIDLTSDLHPNDLVAVDLDGDGLKDLATANNYSTLGSPASISLFRNNSSKGKPAFARRIDYNSGVLTYAIASGDFDKDGKPDLVSSTIRDNSIIVYKNTSTPGSIELAQGRYYIGTGSIYDIAVADIDGDGRLDIATINALENTLSVYLNTSTGVGSISFAPRANFTTGLFPNSLSVADFDKDGKPDVAVSNQLGSSVSVFRNTSQPGTLNFTSKLDFSLPTGTTSYGIIQAELNGDDKPDLAMAAVWPNYNTNGIVLLKNLSSSGTISFNQENLLSGGKDNAYQVAAGDVNGDGKNDLVLGSTTERLLRVYQNNSSSTAVNFSLAGSFYAPSPYALLLEDLDQNNKPELCSSYFIADQVQVYPNVCGSPEILAFTPQSGVAGTKVRITGKNFNSISQVMFGTIHASSFQLTGKDSLEAIVDTGASGEIKLVNDEGFDTLSEFIFEAPPLITSFSPDTAFFVGSTFLIKGYNFTGVTGVNFGGLPAMSFRVLDPHTIEAFNNNGNTGPITVSTSFGKNSKPGFVFFPRPKLMSFGPQSAPTGGSISLNGINLSAVKTVTIGGVPAASFSIVNDYTISAVVGNGATGSIVVSNEFGSSEINGFTYMPPPVVKGFSPNSVPLGFTVNIWGSNFENVSSVQFGGRDAASFTVLSKDSIKAVLSSGETGVVKVTTAAGSSSLPGFQFIYKPSITQCTPTIGGEGTAVLITGSSLANATSVKFGDTPAASFVQLSPDSIKAIVGAAGSTGFVSVGTIAGSSNGAWFYFCKQPLITTLSPRAGKIGSTVTITGANFPTDPKFTIVKFGAVNGRVLTSTANRITVEVPAGATYESITVTSLQNGLTAVSDVRFQVITNNGGFSFTDSSFAGKLDLTVFGTPLMLKQGDLDGDGKTDLAAILNNSKTISFFLNRSLPGSLSFDKRTDFTVPVIAKSIHFADLDGDGKLDLLVSSDIDVNSASNIPTIWIYRNTSSQGKLSFEPATTLTGMFYFIGYMETTDLNFDGKIDLLLVCTNCGAQNGGIFIAMNNATGKGISFDTPTLRGFGVQNPVGVTSGVKVTDLNDDGRMDLMVGLWSGSATFLMENVTQQSSFPFFNNKTIGDPGLFNGYGSFTPQVANFSFPNQYDLLVNRYIYGKTLWGYTENYRTTAVVSGVADFDCDGKLDIVGRSYVNDEITLVRNSTDSSVLKFEKEFGLKEFGNSIVAGDYDGDGKPEIAFLPPSPTAIRIRRNRMGEPLPEKPQLISFTPQTATTGEMVGLKGKNLSQVTEIKMGGVAVGHFMIVSDDSLALNVGTGSSGKIAVYSPGGADSLGDFTYVNYPAPVVSSFTPIEVLPGERVTIQGQYFQGVNKVSFGGIAADSFGIVSSTQLVAKPGLGASGRVEVTSFAGNGGLDGFVYHGRPVFNSFSPKTGPSGTWVTLKGTYLNEVIPTAVYFGSTKADSVKLVDSATLLAKGGVGNDGPITAAALSGSAGTSEYFYFTKTPVLNSFNPVTAKKGGKVTLTGNNLHTATQVSFGGSPAASFSIDTYNQLTATVGDGNSGEVKVTNANGTASLGGFVYEAVTASNDLNLQASSFLISPNPARGNAQVQFPVSHQTAYLELTDENGRIILKKRLNRLQTTELLELKGLASGTYQLTWKSNKMQLIKKIIVLQ